VRRQGSSKNGKASGVTLPLLLSLLSDRIAELSLSTRRAVEDELRRFAAAGLVDAVGAPAGPQQPAALAALRTPHSIDFRPPASHLTSMSLRFRADYWPFRRSAT
jgi:hypothetical protein